MITQKKQELAGEAFRLPFLQAEKPKNLVFSEKIAQKPGRDSLRNCENTDIGGANTKGLIIVRHGYITIKHNFLTAKPIRIR